MKVAVVNKSGKLFCFSLENVKSADKFPKGDKSILGWFLSLTILYSYARTITDKHRSLKILLGTGQIK